MNVYSLILSFVHCHYSTGGVNQDCWVLEYPWQLEKNKDWSDGVLEWWKRIRTGVLASGS